MLFREGAERDLERQWHRPAIVFHWGIERGWIEPRETRFGCRPQVSGGNPQLRVRGVAKAVNDPVDFVEQSGDLVQRVFVKSGIEKDAAFDAIQEEERIFIDEGLGGTARREPVQITSAVDRRDCGRRASASSCSGTGKRIETDRVSWILGRSALVRPGSRYIVP